MMSRLDWSGVVLSVQPRIRLLRSFDERSHSYLGYNLLVDGTIGLETRSFLIGLGPATYLKHACQVGDEVCGASEAVVDRRIDPAEFYKTVRFRVLRRGESQQEPPPWHGPAVELDTYRERGHRRLATRTYIAKCVSCVWGCRMAVEMLIDPWSPSFQYRYETFCYGPKSCPLYQAGPMRIVPGRKGMSYQEEDWVDEDAVSHRGADE